MLECTQARTYPSSNVPLFERTFARAYPCLSVPLNGTAVSEDESSLSPASLTSASAQRTTTLARLKHEEFDLIVVGGGATGLGIALDASLRGLSVAVLDSHDFAKGTSSRATKLVHGGVRYLAQGRVGLVRESLRERTALLRNAPGLVKPLPFVMPAYRSWEIPFYGAGLAIYDLLAGHDGLGHTRVLSRGQVRQRLPGVRADGLKGGIQYWDAQFDDARLAIVLARAAAARGAAMANYCSVRDLVYCHGKISGVLTRDAETGDEFTVRALCVVNAAGVWVDTLRRIDAKSLNLPESRLIRASRGTHLVVDRRFFPSEHALLVPRTSDGRVLFVVPWLGKVLLGTTDVETASLDPEPRPDMAEIRYILDEVKGYLRTPPQLRDVRSAWAGLRPLVNPSAMQGHKASSSATRDVSREHVVEVSRSGLVSVAGGKWTTYRAMAQDVVDICVRRGLLRTNQTSRTLDFPIEAALSPKGPVPAQAIVSPPPQGHKLSSTTTDCRFDDDMWLTTDERKLLVEAGLSATNIIFAADFEFARTVEDILARRSRVLFLDAALAIRTAPLVARILQTATLASPRLSEFLELADQYVIDGASGA